MYSTTITFEFRILDGYSKINIYTRRFCIMIYRLSRRILSEFDFRTLLILTIDIEITSYIPNIINIKIFGYFRCIEQGRNKCKRSAI